jgi:hypothetical protein
MRGFFPTSEIPPGYEALRAFWAAPRAHLPLQMRPKEVGDAVPTATGLSCHHDVQGGSPAARLEFEPRKSESQTPYHRCARLRASSTPHGDRAWGRILLGLALVAQRIEHLTTDQKVGGSSPSERAQVSGRFRSWDRPFACRVQQRSTATLTATAVHRLASSPWSSSWSSQSLSRRSASLVTSSGTWV